jgi:hypothetical protein
MDEEVRLRRRSLWLARLTMTLLVATALIILQPIVLGVAGAGSGSGWQGRRLGAHLAFSAAVWLPSCFYLYSLWAIGRAFGSYGRGGTINDAMAKGCRRAGLALALGATASAVGVPLILGALLRSGIITASRYGAGTVLIFDTAYLAVGIVGLALFLLGGLLARVARLAEEAQALRSELGEFV